MDEVVMAGGKWATGNSSYYLYNGQNYWTMSPNHWSGSCAFVFVVNRDGRLNRWSVHGGQISVRPVINLKADTLFAAGGTGTLENPYIVSD